MLRSDAHDDADDEDRLGGTVVVAYSNSTRRACRRIIPCAAATHGEAKACDHCMPSGVVGRGRCR
jgi:hypothetical protein